jgi:hypothetical protein
MSKEINFKEIIVKSKKYPKLSVSLNWDCGEGYDGYYDASDPTDAPLLRFDVMVKGEQVDDGSYCTLLKATYDRKLLRAAAKEILKESEDKFNGKTFSGGFKKLMEQLSWINIENGQICMGEER